ncbi:hypothetical protein [Nakamurella panacisegetis]|uniref:hypothetical protein n=1 Tax=Nakamurella panacisegetis TaxID=1090615 RepID=UPI0012FD6981|nr:hypothetical protein [Nakamurella panacisegetis]
MPLVSNVNQAPGRDVPNLAVVPIGPDGKVRLFNDSTGSVQLLVDVVGYFTSAVRPVFTDAGAVEQRWGTPARFPARRRISVCPST